MKLSIWTALAAALLLGACGQKAEDTALPDAAVAERTAEEGAQPAKFGFKEALAPAAPDGSDPRQTTPAEPLVPDDVTPPGATAPRIAYAYTYGFRVSAVNLPGLQRSHAELCEQMGPQSCRVMELSQSGGEDDYASGKLVLEVTASKARSFGTQLDTVAEGVGAEQISSEVTGEDLSRQIVDTEAKLRARTLLRDRLMELLASRKGTVAELIEAERGVAAVNQEIDEAKSWLNEMKGRVEFSRVEISYETEGGAGRGFLMPISAVVSSLGVILGGVIAALIALTAAALPIGLFWIGARWLWRKGRELQQRVDQEGPEIDVASLFTPPPPRGDPDT
ncbi:DUF4349 domain-containing protein [Novosphingobium sp.]|uniref:DUF4349 domain-containing protein n=1 Tax=Novosphingobium sp. TaxID=1874826 RepID=UPI0035AED321